MSTSLRIGASRRALMIAAAGIALAPSFAHASEETRAEMFPLSAVRLAPSIYLDAVNTNRTYLLSLDPDRLLHNFRKGAGLTPKGDLYGGWEARGIAGHILGHYLSACSLMFAQTGDEQVGARVRYIVAELAACQAAHGDGYVGGTTVERDGAIVDGKVVYEELRRGDVRTGPFDVNGGWVPIYTWHKVHAGLLDAHRHCGNAQALTVAVGLSDHLIGCIGGFDDATMQRFLAAEHGGVNETFAEMYARTGERRYLEMAERLRHRAVLDPLAAEVEQLEGLHANTQIPKVVGLARLHELTGDPTHARAARFFYDRVTQAHSYAIGGNSEREHFGAPNVIASRLTDRTCEACNSYNMLRLTRHLWSWRQDGSYFDYAERAHLNHIMAHQHPRTGMFVYFMPMTPGARREFSTPTDSMWCCVGSGMESHSKHGESIYGRRDDTLFVNLFIPSTLEWTERARRFALETRYPDAEEVTLRVVAPGDRRRFPIALRLPGWCDAPRVAVNGDAVRYEQSGGYAVITRRWRAGDAVTLALPMRLQATQAPDDPQTIAYLSGPVVLAADLGPADQDLTVPTPALRRGDPASGVVREGAHVYRAANAHGAALTLRPFYAQHDRRTAPYLKQMSDADWSAHVAAFHAAEAERIALDARTIDVIRLGEAASEAAHAYRANHADLLSYERVSGRQAWWGEGNYFECELAVRPGPMALHALYWGEEVNKNFEIKVDGRTIVNERRADQSERAFVTREYAIAPALTRGKTRITVRVETRGSDAPLYRLRTVTLA